MMNPEGSIVPLLREIRAMTEGGVIDLDRREALVQTWVERLQSNGDFPERIGRGEDLLFRHALDAIDQRLRRIEYRMRAIETDPPAVT